MGKTRRNRARPHWENANHHHYAQTPHRMCRWTGKRAYPSEHTALVALRQQINQYPNRRHPDHAYLCEMCNRWHLTSMTVEQYRALARRRAEAANWEHRGRRYR